MKQFNFAAPKIYREIFKPGGLVSLAEEIYSGKDRKAYKGLTLDEFAKTPTLYSTFNPRELSILDLEDETVYKTTNGKEVLGADIKAFTMLMYDKPRTAYLEFGRVKQVHETMYSGAVPYPLLGFKRFHNIEYDKWRKMFDSGAYLDKSMNMVEEDGALEKAFKIDILLGNTFSSTQYDASTDQIVWKDSPGLLLLSTLRGVGYRPNPETLQYLRIKGMGNHRGSFASSYGTARVDISKDEKIDNDIINMYNKAGTPMRLLMSQRWAWYGNHRCDDMIMDFQDWGHKPKKYDTVENAFTGLKPMKGTTGGIGAHFGIGGSKV